MWRQFVVVRAALTQERMAGSVVVTAILFRVVEFVTFTEVTRFVFIIVAD
jgi:hypothetical protein